MALSPHALRLKVLTMALTAVWRREWGENKDPLLARCLDNKWLKQPAGIRVCCKLGLWQCDPTNFDTRCENFIRRNFDFLPAEITFTIVCGTAPHCLTYLNDYNNRWYTIIDTFPLLRSRRHPARTGRRHGGESGSCISRQPHAFADRVETNDGSPARASR